MKLNIKDQLKVKRSNVENYKSLRTNVELCGAENQIIAITSSIPGEGKSTVSIHLAYELANTEKRVLFIDADLRKSMFYERYGVSKEERLGLADLLAKKASIKDVLWNTDVPGLNLILPGSIPPNPSELLGSAMWKKMLDTLRGHYDYVIIDTPPLANVSDCAVLCQSCDGVILVIGSDMISSRVVGRVKKQLERTGCKILGVILNKVKISNRTTYGTYGTYLGDYISHKEGYYE